MKWIEVKIVLDYPDKDLAIDLISDVFYDFGVQGVVVEDPRIEPEEGWLRTHQHSAEHANQRRPRRWTRLVWRRQ